MLALNGGTADLIPGGTENVRGEDAAEYRRVKIHDDLPRDDGRRCRQKNLNLGCAACRHGRVGYASYKGYGRRRSRCDGGKYHRQNQTEQNATRLVAGEGIE